MDYLRLLRHNLHCFQKKKTISLELNRGDKENSNHMGEGRRKRQSILLLFLLPASHHFKYFTDI